MLRWTVRAATVAVLAGLAGCGGDGYCWDCGGPGPGSGVAPQVSLGLVAGDFTGSGHPSIVSTNTVTYQSQGNPGYLVRYLATGAGAYAAGVVTEDGNDPLYLASAPLTHDGLPDVVSASYVDGQLAVFLNIASSPGTFAAPLLLTSPGASQVAIGDMNGDGLPDLVSADFQVSLFVQTSPGSFAAPVGLYSGGANWVALGDLNGDGVPDIALTDNVGVKLLFHTGAASSATYSAPTSLSTPTEVGANLIAIADVNGDHANDLVITDPGAGGCNSATVLVFLQSSAGAFSAPVSYPTPGACQATSIVVTDVNADGRPDIIIGSANGVTVLLQSTTSPGTFAAAVGYPAPNANEIAVADVNGDGHPDIVVATGPAQAEQNGVIPNAPGVLLQSSASPGTFGTLQALP